MINTYCCILTQCQIISYRFSFSGCISRNTIRVGRMFAEVIDPSTSFSEVTSTIPTGHDDDLSVIHASSDKTAVPDENTVYEI